VTDSKPEEAGVPADLDALLEAIDAPADPEADAVVDDALNIDSFDEAAAVLDVLEDSEADEAGEPVEGEDVEGEVALAAVASAPASSSDEESGDVEDETEVDPYEAFRAELRSLPGKWYVIHSYAGFEKRVKSNIESRKTSMGMEDFVFQVEVPMEDVVEIKNGQRKLVTRVRIPGYVLVRMFLNEDSWSVVRHTPGVTGFVGNSHNPTPLRFEEAFNMLKSLVEIKEVPTAKNAGGKGGKAVSRSIPAEVDFEIGETITIKEGSFAGLPGSISEIKPESGKLTVLVSLFERETPVELSFDQVTKL
jgi:transcriptional antiterminator NusG